MDFLSLLALLALVVIALPITAKIKQRGRERFIDDHRFPSLISKAVLDSYPHLSTAQVQQVLLGLKQYFQLCNHAGRQLVAMPSQVVDVAWHAYILSTRQYQQFCQNAFGRFLHHTPAEAMQSPTQAQLGIKRAWRIACAREQINPKTPDRLPLLFALDAELGIANGFRYQLDCQARNGSGYCASHIGCSSGCAGSSGSDSGCSGGDGGGCGGGD